MGLLEIIKGWFAGGKKAGDKILRCFQCGKDFTFEAGEQAFFRERGLSEPKRCPSCRRESRRGRHRR